MSHALEALENFPYQKAVKSDWMEVLDNGILIVPFWTEEYCDLVIAAAEEHGRFEPLVNDYISGNSPGEELRISELSPIVLEHYKNHWRKHLFKPIGDHFHCPYVFNRDWNIFRDPFLVRYSMDRQREMNCHHDFSLLTISVKLSKDSDYKGTEIEFPLQNWNNSGVPRGYGIIFPGQISHPHYVKPLEEGVRYGLTGWIRGPDLKNVDP